MDYWEHREWWQQHENILRAFQSLEKSNERSTSKIQDDLQVANSTLANIDSGLSEMNSKISMFMSYYAQDRALTAQLEAERFEFKLHWESLTIPERKDFLRARDELLAKEAEEQRIAALEWEAGADERDRNHQLIVEENHRNSILANQKNKEYLESLARKKTEALERLAEDRSFESILNQAKLALWMGFGFCVALWFGLASLWASATTGGSMAVCLVLLAAPFGFSLLACRLIVGVNFSRRFEKAVFADAKASAFRQLHSIPTPQFRLKFPYLR